MSAEKIDPSKVRAGDTVTLENAGRKVIAPVSEREHPDAPRAWALDVYSDAAMPATFNRDVWTLTDHQPAPAPEWKPGTVGTAAVRGVEGVRVMRVSTQHGEWFSAIYADGFYLHPESVVTDFVPDDAEALRAEVEAANAEVGEMDAEVKERRAEVERLTFEVREAHRTLGDVASLRDAAHAEAERLRDLFKKAKQDARTIVGGGTGIRFDGVQIIEAETFIRLMQERAEALHDKDTWIARHNQEIMNAMRVQNEMAEGIKKVAAERDEARAEAQAAREVSVSEYERAEEFFRQVKEEHKRVDGLRRTIDTEHTKWSGKVTAQRHELDAQGRKIQDQQAEILMLRARLAVAKKEALPDDLTKCACTHHAQYAGGGHTEYLEEYEPACPIHSEHVYDPKSGVWEKALRKPTRDEVASAIWPLLSEERREPLLDDSLVTRLVAVFDQINKET